MLAVYKKYSAARKLAERLQKAYPDRGQFCALQSPNDFTWTVGLTKENKILAYSEKPTGPLPGEPGYVKKNKWLVEYTDTFGGQANYSWVNRQTIYMKPEARVRDIMRAAKAAVGLTGVRGVTNDSGDTIEFNPYRMCTILFVVRDCY
jgi:hypothetical protein